jgi:hypothetical protein
MVEEYRNKFHNINQRDAETRKTLEVKDLRCEVGTRLLASIHEMEEHKKNIKKETIPNKCDKTHYPLINQCFPLYTKIQLMNRVILNYCRVFRCL